MKTKFLTGALYVSAILLLLVTVISCQKKDDPPPQDFVVAFKNPSMSFSATEEEKEVTLAFSRAATEAGTIVVKYEAKNAEYGNDKDFTTVPAAVSGAITLDVKVGDTNAKFTFKKLKNPLEGTDEMSVSFEITRVNMPQGKTQGNTKLSVSFTKTASLGGSFAPEVGGPNEPNQVYFDLSSESSTVVKRDRWDFGFYCGDDFRVILNGSIYMAATESGVAHATIDDVNETHLTEAIKNQIKVGPGGIATCIDDPSGDITKTVIQKIAENDSDNKVYLINAGFKVGTETPPAGSVKIEGAPRGWKKIRILRSGDGYKLEYANLNANTHKTIEIAKSNNFNFRFFSLDAGDIVGVEPEAKKWDLNFTVFSNLIPDRNPPYALLPYGFSDFVTHNRHGGVTAYEVLTIDFAYKDFTKGNVANSKFSENQTAIGSHWRNVLPRKFVKDDRFYVIKDAAGNIYKLKFIAMLNEKGERGYPKFEYALLK